MQCDRCHKRKATNHETVLEGGEKREIHLCDECAGGSQIGGMEIMGLLSGAFSAAQSAPAPSAQLQCPACRMEYGEFRATGRLGCPQCYAVFSDALDPLLERIHGQRHHVGKAPGEGRRGDRSRQRRLVELRRRLQSLVKEERYEEAAVARDELQKLEAQVADEVEAAAAEGDPPAPGDAPAAGGGGDEDR